MVEVGTILSNGVTIYLVNKVNENGSVTAQVCSGDANEFSPIEGAVITLTPDLTKTLKTIGKVNEV